MRAFLVLIAVILVSCKSNTKQLPGKPAGATIHVFNASQKLPGKKPVKADNDTLAEDESVDAFADYYVVVADTGPDYHRLHDKMFALKDATGLAIDTMGRFFNEKKDLIALPDNDSDEVYAGDYFPRRSPSQNLSLEYMAEYKPGSKSKTIALIAGIYENKSSADSALKTILPQGNAFAIKSRIYVGCMH